MTIVCLSHVPFIVPCGLITLYMSVTIYLFWSLRNYEFIRRRSPYNVILSAVAGVVGIAVHLTGVHRSMHENTNCIVYLLLMAITRPIYVFAHLVRLIYFTMAHQINIKLSNLTNLPKSLNGSPHKTPPSTLLRKTSKLDDMLFKDAKIESLFINISTILLTGRRYLQTSQDSETHEIADVTTKVFSFNRLLRSIIFYTIVQVALIVLAMGMSLHLYKNPGVSLEYCNRHTIDYYFPFLIFVCFEVFLFVIGLYSIRKSTFNYRSNR
jgi:hypothetical protein